MSLTFFLKPENLEFFDFADENTPLTMGDMESLAANWGVSLSAVLALVRVDVE